MRYLNVVYWGGRLWTCFSNSGTPMVRHYADYTSTATNETSITPQAFIPMGDRLYLVDSNRLEVWITDREGVIERVIKLATAPLEEARQDMIVGRVDVYGDKMLLGMPSEARVRVYDVDGNLLTSVGQRGSAPCHLARPVVDVASG